MKKSIICLALVCGLIATGCDSGFDDIDDDPVPDIELPRRIGLSAVDYRPAPGQFVNDMPAYEPGDTPDAINAKALSVLNSGGLVSLGAFGGEIIMTLSEPIIHNDLKDCDFRILGNSYITGTEGNTVYGSAEPGMVWVMEDVNANGLPDDTWYRFVGDMGDRIEHITVTYRPVAEPTAQKWVEWVTDSGETGFLTCNPSFHSHTYFPQWIFADPDRAELTVTGYAVPANGGLDPATGLYRQICYRGFADCFPNYDERSAFSLREAVDLNGKKANIRRVDFVKVTTAVLDSNGPLGEASTEVGGIEIP